MLDAVPSLCGLLQYQPKSVHSSVKECLETVPGLQLDGTLEELLSLCVSSAHVSLAYTTVHDTQRLDNVKKEILAGSREMKKVSGWGALVLRWFTTLSTKERVS